ncbi:MAG: hypothetical protein HYU99_00255 [Deltaproteobacteria bacterium]|nr:hypothetical protein [Deltaproteobacteria bacterium]
MIVGMSAAILQGTPSVTKDIDLWFKKLDDPNIMKAAQKAGGAYVPTIPTIMNPPQFAGAGLDVFDIVTNASGLVSFDEEYKNTKTVLIDSLLLRVLPLERVLASKKSANRPKDQAVFYVLEQTLLALQKKKSAP